MKIDEHSSVSQERRHTRSQIWWLAERGSPAIYLGDGGLTREVWDAKRFSFLELAHEFINSNANRYGTAWLILDHMFYI